MLCLELDGESIEKADGLRERVSVIGNATKLKITLYTRQRQLLTSCPCVFALILKCCFRSDNGPGKLGVNNFGVINELLSHC